MLPISFELQPRPERSESHLSLFVLGPRATLLAQRHLEDKRLFGGVEDAVGGRHRHPVAGVDSVVSLREWTCTIPGNSTDMHVTPTIDYALVMAGEIDMEIDNGVVVHLHEGDVLVQRATVHNWLNKGPGICKMAFVLMDAQP